MATLLVTPHTPSPSPPIPSSPGSLSDSASLTSSSPDSTPTPVPFIRLPSHSSSPSKPQFTSYVAIAGPPTSLPLTPHAVLASSSSKSNSSSTSQGSPSPPVPTRTLSISTTSTTPSPPQPFFTTSSFASPTALEFPTSPSAAIPPPTAPPPPPAPLASTSSSTSSATAPSIGSSSPKFVIPGGPTRERDLERKQSVSTSRAGDSIVGAARERRQSQKAWNGSSASSLGGSAGTDAPVLRTRKQSQQQASRQLQFGTQTPPSGSTRSSAGTGAQSTTDANQLEAKVVILGSQGVGKTSIVHRATSGLFSRSLSSTLGASFLTKRLVVDGCKVRLQLWDTAGQERFRSMAPLYYRGALAAILVYDISNLQSFYDVKIWLDELRRNMAPDLIIHVVGSKLDLAPQRQVDLTFARRSIAQWLSEGVPSLPLPLEISPTRPRTRTTSVRTAPAINAGLGSLPTSASMPSIASAGGAPLTSSTTSSTAPLTTNQAQNMSALGARARRISKPVTLGGLSPTSTTVAASATSGNNSSGSSVVSESNTLVVGTSVSPPEGISRSGSRLSLGLGLGMTGSRGRRSYEEERKTAEELENEKLDELVKTCGVEVTEASAEDDDGIEDIFLLITQRLVDRKASIESERILRSRDSVMLNDAVSPTTTTNSSWCC